MLAAAVHLVASRVWQASIRAQAIKHEQPMQLQPALTLS